MPVSTINTYNDLKNALADYLARDDLVVQIPLFIQLFEEEANRRIRNRQQQVRFTIVGGTVAGQAYYALPADFLQTHQVVLLTDLCEGQAATVLQLPAQPTTEKEAQEQRRVIYVG